MYRIYRIIAFFPYHWYNLYKMYTEDEKIAAIIPEYGSAYPTKQQQEIRWHVNQGLELVYMAKGEVPWQYEAETILSKAGTLSFSWPGQFHGSAKPLVPVSEMHWIIIRLEAPDRFHRGLGLSAGENRSIIEALHEIEPQIIEVNTQIEFYFREVIRLLELRSQGDRRNQISRLVTLLLLNIAKEKALFLSQDQSCSATKQKVKDFLGQLEQEASEDWSLEKMCESCGIARTRFATIVKELTGESPIKTLNRFRIQRARNLLSSTDLRITDIAFQCGFSSSQHFSAAFKAYHGISPKTFRRNMESSKEG